MSVKRTSLFQYWELFKLVRLKLNQNDLELSSLMEKLTNSRVKDCFTDEETVYIIVAPGQIGKVLGKGGENIRRVQKELGKRVKVIEFDEDAKKFVRNVISPIYVDDVSQEEGQLKIKDSSKKTKSLLIGRGGKNLNIINRAVKRFFSLEVKVE